MTATPETLRTLAERVMQAAPGRELDARIQFALASPNIEPQPDAYYDSLARDYADDDSLIPFYTTSLDAAMSLVPEGSGWFVGDTRASGGEAWAEIYPSDGMAQDLAAPTPAQALTAAALLAKA